MKKLLTVALAVIMAAMLLAGCAAPAAPASAAAPAASGKVDQIKAAGKLIMLTEAAFPPFEYLGADNTIQGVDVDIATEVAKELGVKLEVIDMSFDGIILAVQSDKGDLGVAGITATDERRKSVDFSTNYVDAAQVIIVPKEGSTVASVADLDGKPVGVQAGTTGDIYVTDETKAEVYRYKTGADASIELDNGKLAAVVLDEMPAKEIVATNDALTILEETLTEEQYAIAVKQGNDDLMAVVNKVLEKMLADGSVAASIEKHSFATGNK